MIVKDKIKNIKNLIPSSISELYYDNRELFKAIIAFTLGFTLASKLWVAFLGILGVYIFRSFKNKKQQIFHYLSAAIAFTSLYIETHQFVPILLGVLAGLIAYLKEKKNYLFWFESVAGLAFIIYILITN